jgi:hypothetical protein
LCVKEEDEEEDGVEGSSEGSSARILDLSGAPDVEQKEGEKEKGQGKEGVIAKSKRDNGEEEEEDDYRNLDREIYSDLCSVHIVMQQVRC